MKRRIFATAVVLVGMATPLLGAQAPSSAQPKAAPAQQPSVKPEQKKSTAGTTKPAGQPQAAAATASPQKPVTGAAAPPAPKPATGPAAKPAPASPAPAAASTAKPAPAQKPAVTTAAASKAPAAPAAPAVRVNPPAASKPDVRPAALTPRTSPSVVASGAALSPMQQRIVRNKELTRELQTRLPGVDVVGAAEGFSDLSQFVAAAHASHNLKIPFDTLKAKLMAAKRTGLRQAIQELRPAASAAIEAQRAQYDANGMIRSTEQATALAEAAQVQKAKPAAPAKPKASSPQQK